MIRQLDGDSLPAGAVDSIVDGGFMELEGGSSRCCLKRRKALALNELPGIRPAETRETALDSSSEAALDSCLMSR